MRENVPYSQILEILTELVDSETSGTLFIRTEANHAITFALDNGRISAIFYGARRGLKAISLISNISGGSYKFEASNLAGISHELPTTPEILNLLRNPHPTEGARPATSSPGAGSERISEENRNILCQQLKSLLAKHLGPIAEMVFDDTIDEAGDFCSTPELARDLINKLSADIDDATEVEQFRSDAYAAINRVLKN